MPSLDDPDDDDADPAAAARRPSRRRSAAAPRSDATRPPRSTRSPSSTGRCAACRPPPSTRPPPPSGSRRPRSAPRPRRRVETGKRARPRSAPSTPRRSRRRSRGRSSIRSMPRASPVRAVEPRGAASSSRARRRRRSASPATCIYDSYTKQDERADDDKARTTRSSQSRRRARGDAQRKDRRAGRSRRDRRDVERRRRRACGCALGRTPVDTMRLVAGIDARDRASKAGTATSPQAQVDRGELESKGERQARSQGDDQRRARCRRARAEAASRIRRSAADPASCRSSRRDPRAAATEPAQGPIHVELDADRRRGVALHRRHRSDGAVRRAHRRARLRARGRQARLSSPSTSSITADEWRDGGDPNDADRRREEEGRASSGRRARSDRAEGEVSQWPTPHDAPRAVRDLGAGRGVLHAQAAQGPHPVDEGAVHRRRSARRSRSGSSCRTGS